MVFAKEIRGLSLAPVCAPLREGFPFQFENNSDRSFLQLDGNGLSLGILPQRDDCVRLFIFLWGKGRLAQPGHAGAGQRQDRRAGVFGQDRRVTRWPSAWELRSVEQE